MNDLEIKKTLADYCAARETAISEYKGLIAGYARISHYLAATGPRLMPTGGQHYGLMEIDDFTRELDRKLWRRAYDQTGLANFFDATAKREFEASIERNPPPFTLENARSALVSSASDANQMLARGVVELFLSLSNRYHTNQKCAFEIGRKFITERMIESSFYRGLQISYRGGSVMDDLDRVMKILERKEFKPGDLRARINGAFAKCEVFEDDYYRMKGFRKGTLHIELKREDLRIKINQIISYYYDGRALADAA
jgi:hypothetical protein